MNRHQGGTVKIVFKITTKKVRPDESFLLEKRPFFALKKRIRPACED